MCATKKRNVEIVSPCLRIEEDRPSPVSFESILSFLHEKEYRIHEKIFECKILQTNIQNCILGIIITTQDHDLPPARDKRTKAFSKLPLNPKEQGLAYGNIFLYDTTRKVLIYEINKNGCFLNQLKEFIYDKWNRIPENDHFNLSFSLLLRLKEYERMLSMNYYKKIQVQIAKPNELIQNLQEHNESLEKSLIRSQLQTGARNNADTISFEQAVTSRRLNPQGLSRGVIRNMVDSVESYIRNGHRGNITKLTVQGYLDDIEGKRRAVTSIDLLADRFNEHFQIPDIQVQTDVQEADRRRGIEGIYNKVLPEIKAILGA